MNIVVATSNKKKLSQIKRIFEGHNFNIMGLADVNIDIKEPEEDGQTCYDNAVIKASYYAKLFPQYAFLADDSGIFIKEFDNAPGVYSARWGGEHSTKACRKKLLEEMDKKNIHESKAYYQCNMCFIYGDTQIDADGKCEGIIKNKMSSDNGLAYDPFFYVNNKAISDYPLEEKDKLNHRGKAANAMIKKILEAGY